VDELKNNLDAALRVLEERGLDPESAGGAVALGYLLSAAPPVSQPAAPGSVSTSLARTTDGDSEPTKALAGWAGVSLDDVLDIFDFGEAGIGIGISSRRLPSSKADCQRALVVLKLAAERVAAGRDSVPAGEINEIASHYGVLDQNLAANVSNKTNMVARRGKRGSWNYRVTQPGLDHAKQLIAKLATGEDIARA
jgi:hypothetical protein